MRGCAGIEEDHVLPVSGGWAIRSECVVVQVSSKITYRLWAGDGRYGVSAWLCSDQGISRTNCVRGMGKTESVGSCAGIEQDHVPSVGGGRAIRSQCVIVQRSRNITYKLWAGDGRYGVSA